MKKIKITEDQAIRLKILNEDANPLVKYELYCRKRAEEVDRCFVKVININIAEILHNEVNIREIYKYLSDIEDQVLSVEKQAYSHIAHMDGEDLDLVIDNATDLVTDKITSLQLIISDLEKIQELNEEHKLLKQFANVKPIDITPQS